MKEFKLPPDPITDRKRKMLSKLIEDNAQEQLKEISNSVCPKAPSLRQAVQKIVADGSMKLRPVEEIFANILRFNTLNEPRVNQEVFIKLNDLIEIPDEVVSEIDNWKQMKLKAQEDMAIICNKRDTVVSKLAKSAASFLDPLLQYDGELTVQIAYDLLHKPFPVESN